MNRVRKRARRDYIRQGQLHWEHPNMTLVLWPSGKVAFHLGLRGNQWPSRPIVPASPTRAAFVRELTLSMDIRGARVPIYIPGK